MTETFKNSMSISLFTILCVACACHEVDLGRPMGALCTDDSDCKDPYVCEYGRCRSECTQDSDCSFGACVPSLDDPAASVCIDESCQTKGDCPKGFICDADGQCRPVDGSDTDAGQGGTGESAETNNTSGLDTSDQPLTQAIRVRGSFVTVKDAQSASGSIRLRESALHIIPRVCNNNGICAIGRFVR